MTTAQLRPTRDCIEHFRRNRAVLPPIPWDLGAELTDAERAAIARSIQAFQLGESSEGRNLMRYARAWAARSGDVDYVEAIRLLIAEEQRHARDLGRFMELNGIACIQHRWTDSVFRALRNLLGTLEISIGVLVTAEIIAKVYYAALREASESTTLHRICDQILRDEVRHVEFQTEQLARLRLGRAPLLLRATLALQQLLFVGATLVVAWSHRPTLARGGFGFRRFWSACRSEFARDFFGQTDTLNLAGRPFAEPLKRSARRLEPRGVPEATSCGPSAPLAICGRVGRPPTDRRL